VKRVKEGEVREKKKRPRRAVGLNDERPDGKLGEETQHRRRRFFKPLSRRKDSHTKQKIEKKKERDAMIVKLTHNCRQLGEEA